MILKHELNLSPEFLDTRLLLEPRYDSKTTRLEDLLLVYGVE